MQRNHSNSSMATSAQAMTTDPIQAVQVAAAMNVYTDFEHEHSAPELQAAVARAVTYGASIKDVADAAHMTSLEVLDAADSLNYHGRRSG
jgi:hypothetical protein